jgi:T-complex protein 1 subunit beta
LKAVPVENPAAKVLVDIAKIQDDTIGDGTTRFFLFLNLFIIL